MAHGGHGKGGGKGHVPHGKTVADWVAKGWETMTVPSKTVASIEITVDHATEEFHLFGQMFGVDGTKLTGRDRPHVGVEETLTGDVVTFSKPTTEDVTVLYKVEAIEPVNGGDEEDRPF